MDINFLQTRRGFLKLGLSVGAIVVSPPAWATLNLAQGSRRLSFYNMHTDESLDVTYWKDGRYSRSAAVKIDQFMRDHYSGETYPIDLRLMDLMHDMQVKMKHEDTFEIISAYRSPKTNSRMASASDGVAKHSYHTKGMALDLRLRGTSLTKVYHTAHQIGRGGVGYYPDSEFVHIDVGPVRQW